MHMDEESLNEINTSLGSIAITSSPRSLVEVPWNIAEKRGSLENSVSVADRLETMSDLPVADGRPVVRLPTWIPMEGPHLFDVREAGDDSKIAIETKEGSFAFPIQRYPATLQEADALAHCVQKWKSLENIRAVFLFGKAESLARLAQDNARSVKNFFSNKPHGPAAPSESIRKRLVSASYTHQVSLIDVDHASIGAALNSLIKIVGREKRKYYGVVLRKREKPEDVLAEMLRAVGGITRREVDALLARFRSVADLCLWSRKEREEVPGIRERTAQKLVEVFGRTS